MVPISYFENVKNLVFLKVFNILQPANTSNPNLLEYITYMSLLQSPIEIFLMAEDPVKHNCINPLF